MTEQPLQGDDAFRDDALRSLYARRTAESGTNVCPEPAAIEALVDVAGDESARLRTLDHIMACAQCQTEFELLRSARMVADDLDRTEKTPSSVGANRDVPRATVRARRIPLALAATLILALAAAALWRTIQAPVPVDTLRGEGAAVTLVSPADNARVRSGEVLRFTWRSVIGARDYRLELLSADGAVIVGASTLDTTHLLADALAARATRATQWRVEAVLADGSRVSSALRALRITP